VAAPPTLAADRRRLTDIRLSEIVAALSHALDITEGQPMAHAERSCLIGLRLGCEAGPKRDAGAFAALEAWLSGRSASFADVA
jgi:hypothetical protein